MQNAPAPTDGLADRLTGAAKEWALPRPGAPPGLGSLRLRRPAATPTRAILPFEPAECCRAGPGLQAPWTEDLGRAGIPRVEWEGAVSDLARRVQPWSCAAATFCIVTAFWQCWPIACTMEAQYHVALRRWLADLNARVLAPRGLAAALQTSTLRERCSPLREVPYEVAVSWLAVSLTRDDAELLVHEPMLWAPTSSCCVLLAGRGDGALVPHPCPLMVGWCGVPYAV